MCVCVCVCVCSKMIDCDETAKMMKIRWNVDNKTIKKEFSCNISFFIREFHQTKQLLSFFTLKQLRK